MGILQSFVVKNRRFLKNIPQPIDPEKNYLVAMKLKHIFSPMILLFCGLTVALTVFFYERCEIMCMKQVVKGIETGHK